MSAAAFVGLFFYFLQQLGMGLGLGAQMVALLLAGKSSNEATASAKKVVRVSLWLIVLSGVCITLAHLAAGEGSVLASPAFLFKWLLIVIAIFLPFAGKLPGIPERLFGAVVASVWLALFTLHTLAPDASWMQLFVPFVLGIVLFVVLYELFTASHASSSPAPEPSNSAPASYRAPAPAPAAAPLLRPTPITAPIQPRPAAKPALQWERPAPSPVRTPAPISSAPAVRPQPIVQKSPQPQPISVAKPTTPPMSSPVTHQAPARVPVHPVPASAPIPHAAPANTPATPAAAHIETAAMRPAQAQTIKIPPRQETSFAAPAVQMAHLIPRPEPAMAQTASPTPPKKEFEYSGLSHMHIMPRSSKDTSSK